MIWKVIDLTQKAFLGEKSLTLDDDDDGGRQSDVGRSNGKEWAAPNGVKELTK